MTVLHYNLCSIFSINSSFILKCKLNFWISYHCTIVPVSMCCMFKIHDATYFNYDEKESNVYFTYLVEQLT